MHPHAFKGSGNGFTDHDGNSVREGNRVLYTIDGRYAIMDEALHDGDAFVTFEDGTFGTVKWTHLMLVDMKKTND